jgi:hypothetical protein
MFGIETQYLASGIIICVMGVLLVYAKLAEGKDNG